MSRDHKAAYARRNQLARQRGFRSYAEQRRYARIPTVEAELRRLPEHARVRRAEALDVIAAARRDRVSVVQAASERRIPLSAVVWWGEPALENPASRTPRVRKADRLLRYHPLVSDGELTFVAIRGSNAAAKARAAFAAQRAFLDGMPGSEEALVRFQGVRIGGRLVETDPDVLGEIGRRGELDDLADTYRALVSS